MEFIRKNPALAVGIGLPVLVVILFSIAAVVPSWVVAPPQYDALFATTVPNYVAHEPGNNEIKFAVSQGHLKAYRRKPPKEGYQVSDTKLFLFDARTLRVHEIFIEPSTSSVGDDWQEFPVPEAQSLKLDPGTTSPDGYEFHDRYNYNGDIWPFFGGGAGREAVSLGKNGREVKIALPDISNMYSGAGLHFLGWVVSRDAK